ncbi:FAD-dependent oxidoreductase [Undibacterium oligocarboniphilum]|uniref:FAD-dependent oxidoreductase n=1 Tax=Undibacterium oligocarboniphilum TaxID=666702 RepID=A0A850QIK1_9BURK|nr:FAD-dependent oxidoreductase [Undibacterium oligocarboniphilum]MBC3871533.1 FAD-dependent oxidoreductase [Undibacterium oligocarboniphilum]NVO79108.1 FAD-dependent oxidoreductase [Undibacterium oligocarboniphilum]
MKPIVIAGSGLAGYTVAREFRQLDSSTPLLIITGDDGSFYSKPMLSNAFAQNKPITTLLSRSAEQMAAQLNATILTNTRIQQIAATRRSLLTSAGEFEFEQLVLAVGAKPVQLTMQGDAADQILSVNHWQDYAELRKRLDTAGSGAHVVILGAGLIGCEFADDFSGAGYRVTLVDPNTLPLAALAPPPVSRRLQQALLAKQVRIQAGTTATHLTHAGTSLQVALTNGQSLTADLVLSAIGLRPDLRLAESAGLATGRGIRVSVFGETSIPGIYALGDCTEYAQPDGAHLWLPYVAPVMAAARTIAQNLSGHSRRIEFKPMPVLVKTPSCPIALMPVAPDLAKRGRWETDEEGGITISRFYDHQDKLRGFGLAPQDQQQRNALLQELGSSCHLIA